MGRRSPVLGYNHNVRYRGVLFHVQTEDSGKLNPHLFTHLFHGGTIVSTRKLVYDPNADDGVVKSLMQAQHKAVMKELRRGVFDDKIDINLRGTPGLLPRGVDDGGVEETNVGALPTPPTSAAAHDAIESLVDRESSPLIEIVDDPAEDVIPAIEITADEPSPTEILLTSDNEPSSPEITVTHHPNMTPPGTPTLDMSSDNTVPTDAPIMDRLPSYSTVPPLPPPPADAAPARTSTPHDGRRMSTPPPMSSASLPPIPPRTNPASTMRGAPPVRQQQAMSAPVVTTRPITRETPPTAERRSDVSQAFESITAPGMEEIAEIHSPAPGSAAEPPGVHPTAAPSSASEYIHKRGDRPMRDDVRSQRMPVINNDRPSSQRIPVQDPRNADAPPSKRPGSGPIAVPAEARPRPASGGIPVQRPGTEGSRPNVTTSAPVRRPSQHPESPPAAAPVRRPSQHPESPAKPPTPPESALPRSGALPPPIPGRSPPPAAATAATRGTPPDNAIPIPRTRTPTAPRPFSASPRQGAPAASQRARTGSGGGASGGGVVMSRPAVIVGARSQTPTPAPTPAAGTQGATPPEQPRTSTNSGARVRRAREEGGGRGVFGQDLISEKSLDEVILAYLSEDASEE